MSDSFRALTVVLGREYPVDLDQVAQSLRRHRRPRRRRLPTLELTQGKGQIETNWCSTSSVTYRESTTVKARGIRAAPKELERMSTQELRIATERTQYMRSLSG